MSLTLEQNKAMKFEMTKYVAVNVTAYTEAVKFYKEVLGLKVEREIAEQLPEGISTETEMSTGILNLFISDDAANSGMIFFEFKTDDFEAAVVKLKEHKCVVTRKFNNRSVMIKDPFGLRFHLYADGAFDENGNLVKD